MKLQKRLFTFGILVIPPTSNTSPISFLFTSASWRAFWQGDIVFLMRSPTRLSNLDLDSLRFMCLGPEESTVRYGRFTSVCIDEESSIFAFSAASFNLCMAMGSLVMSKPCCNTNIQISKLLTNVHFQNISIENTNINKSRNYNYLKSTPLVWESTRVSPKKGRLYYGEKFFFGKAFC